MTRTFTTTTETNLTAALEGVERENRIARDWASNETARNDALSICIKWCVSGLILCILFYGATS